jgi:Rrf2 family protein
MLSQTAEYALRAMVVLASAPGVPRTAQEIAGHAKVPLDYLAKIMLALGRAGLVHSQRGRGGGFTVARPTPTIAVLDVINAVDPIRRIESCPLYVEAHAAGLCSLHRKLDDAIAYVENAFATTSLADVAAEPLVCTTHQGGICHVKAAG